jgi:hypothetical protein
MSVRNNSDNSKDKSRKFNDYFLEPRLDSDVKRIEFLMANGIGQQMLWKKGTTDLYEMLASSDLTSFNCSQL